MQYPVRAVEWPDFHEHARFVRKIVWTFRRQHRVPPHVQMEDLMAEGMMGLVEARHRFNPEGHAAFTTFAWRRVTGRILDYLRSQCRKPQVDVNVELGTLPDQTSCNLDSAMELQRVLEQAESLPPVLHQTLQVMMDHGGRSNECCPVLGVDRHRYVRLRNQVRQQLLPAVAA